MAKKKEQGEQPEVETTEATVSESPKAGGSWKAAVNVTCLAADGNHIKIMAGEVVPSDLPKEELESMIKDGLIVKG